MSTDDEMAGFRNIVEDAKRRAAERQIEYANHVWFWNGGPPKPISRRARIRYRVRRAQQNARARVALWIAPWLGDEW